MFPEVPFEISGRLAWDSCTSAHGRDQEHIGPECRGWESSSAGSKRSAGPTSRCSARPRRMVYVRLAAVQLGLQDVCLLSRATGAVKVKA